ncbi:MAG TPA: hypothetical protein PLI09_21160 [Candidatus Hydrogenedentes bacterium]|nr:hypothetical protein [Candidatus Hydrogenedentota bacterium]
MGDQDATSGNPQRWKSVLAPRVENRIIQLFVDYQRKFKPLLAEVEAQQQCLPAEILNEIRAIFDHLSRCYDPVNKDDEEKVFSNLEKARNHLKRAILDCYKTSILYLHDEIERFMESINTIDMTVVNNGKFYERLLELRHHAKQAYYVAKMHESVELEHVDFDSFQSALARYHETADHIRENLNAIEWAKQRTVKKSFFRCCSR